MSFRPARCEEEEGPVPARAREPPASLPARPGDQLDRRTRELPTVSVAGLGQYTALAAVLDIASAAAGGGITFCHEAMAGS